MQYCLYEPLYYVFSTDAPGNNTQATKAKKETLDEVTPVAPVIGPPFPTIYSHTGGSVSIVSSPGKLLYNLQLYAQGHSVNLEGLTGVRRW